MMLGLIDEAVKAGARLESACKEAGIDVRTTQRWRRNTEGEDRRRGPKTRPSNALTAAEEKDLVELLTAPEFVDLSPAQIVPKLADMQIYKASERTMYRVLERQKLLARGKTQLSTACDPDLPENIRRRVVVPYGPLHFHRVVARLDLAFEGTVLVDESDPTQVAVWIDGESYSRFQRLPNLFG